MKEELNNNVYSIGYKSLDDVCLKWTHHEKYAWKAFGYIILKILGLFLSILALQIGSTFWFDSLSKVINIRGTGKKPDEKPKIAESKKN